MFFRKIAAAIAVAASAIVVVSGLTACTDDSNYGYSAPAPVYYAPTLYSRICEDPTTGLRVPDYECSGNSNSLLWYYILYSHTMPGVGVHVYGGSTVYPHGYKSTFVSAPVKGGYTSAYTTAKARAIASQQAAAKAAKSGSGSTGSGLSLSKSSGSGYKSTSSGSRSSSGFGSVSRSSSFGGKH